ncbi:MAG: ribonuclease Z [Euryarchaeota archaeon]|nr:ribonuclease Z [Euryarchaeota archaeon]
MVMRVVFLGTGEAFGSKPNTCLLVNRELLLDCGPHALLQLRKLGAELERIKAVVLSHLHGDHFLGMPALLLACREDGREEKLTIVGPEGTEQAVRELLMLSYRREVEALGYEVEFLVPEGRERLASYNLSFCSTLHGVETLCVSVERRRKLVYLCDGVPTQDCVALARGAHLLVAEAYSAGARLHSSPEQAARIAAEAGAEALALVHIYRGASEEELRRAGELFPRCFIPGELEEVEV